MLQEDSVWFVILTDNSGKVAPRELSIKNWGFSIRMLPPSSGIVISVWANINPVKRAAAAQTRTNEKILINVYR